MIKQLTMVNEFMQVMGQEMPGSPCIPSEKIVSLRNTLISSENTELIDAAQENDLVEVADALCDILYVALGAFTAYGFNPELVEELFDEVQRSNMSKTCTTQEEAEATIDKLLSEDLNSGDYAYTEYSMREVGKYWIVERVSDGKVQKSINFSQPDLKSILIKHGVTL